MKVDSAEFQVLAEPPVPEWLVRVTVKGEGFVKRAIPLGARVGDFPVEGIVTNLDSTGFTGYLRGEPADGDHLFVGYLQGELEDTGIIYQRNVV